MAFTGDLVFPLLATVLNKPGLSKGARVRSSGGVLGTVSSLQHYGPRQGWSVVIEYDDGYTYIYDQADPEPQFDFQVVVMQEYEVSYRGMVTGTRVIRAPSYDEARQMAENLEPYFASAPDNWEVEHVEGL